MLVFVLFALILWVQLHRIHQLVILSPRLIQKPIQYSLPVVNLKSQFPPPEPLVPNLRQPAFHFHSWLINTIGQQEFWYCLQSHNVFVFSRFNASYPFQQHIGHVFLLHVLQLNDKLGSDQVLDHLIFRILEILACLLYRSIHLENPLIELSLDKSCILEELLRNNRLVPVPLPINFFNKGAGAGKHILD